MAGCAPGSVASAIYCGGLFLWPASVGDYRTLLIHHSYRDSVYLEFRSHGGFSFQLKWLDEGPFLHLRTLSVCRASDLGHYGPSSGRPDQASTDGKDASAEDFSGQHVKQRFKANGGKMTQSIFKYQLSNSYRDSKLTRVK